MERERKREMEREREAEVEGPTNLALWTLAPQPAESRPVKTTIYVIFASASLPTRELKYKRGGKTLKLKKRLRILNEMSCRL